MYADEYVYISDNLRVGVRTQPVSGTPPISVVVTGMKLKVEEKTGGYIKVTTSEGVSGWIRDIYATSKAPAIIQLNDVLEKYETLQKEREKDLSAFAILEKTNSALNEQITELKAEQRELEKDRNELMASQPKDSSWFWLAGIFILSLACFIAGALWYRTQAMNRLGGLRV